MADKYSTSVSNSDLTDANECTSPDDIPIDTGASGFPYYHSHLMPYPYTGEELSDDRILEAMEQFVYGFTKRYSTSGPPLCMGSLHQAMAHSLYDVKDSRPLILFIYHHQSASTNVFCEQVLCKDNITNFIAENFIVWAWDRTNEINYQRLLGMLHTHLGNEVKEIVASSPIDVHPMLICLIYNNGQVEVTNVIQGSVSNNDTLTLLRQARELFDRRIEIPDPTDYHLKPVSNEGWSMSSSVLKSIESTSEEFKRIANEFVGQSRRFIQIDKIENSFWLFQYLSQKKDIYNHCNHDQIEQLLIFPCSQASATHILHNGFNDDHKCIPEKKYGHGFYFLSPAAYKNRYPSANSSNGSQKTMLICRVLVGRTCLGNWMIETCPSEYDSTTDGLDTYIVYSNRSILPIYYIKY